MTDRPGMFSANNPSLQIAWDASSLKPFLACPRKYEYSIINGWRSPGTNEHLTFGLALHAGLEGYDRALALGASRPDAVHAGLQALALHFPGWGETQSNYKTPYTAARAVVWYDAEFGETPLLPYVFPDGTVAVELSFRVPLPIKAPGTDENYILCGYFDGLCEYGGEIFVRERKTTKGMLNKRYFDQWSPEPQVSTYALAADLLYPDLRIAGVMLEGVQTGVNFCRFGRRMIKRTPEQREEWLNELPHWFEQAARMAERGHFPMNEGSCHQFFGCEFRDICSKSKSKRQMFLEHNFEHRPWNALAERQ